MRVAIIEDNEIDRLNLATLLEDHESIEIAGEAATLEDAVKLIDKEKPDAIFLDIHLGRQKGFKVLEQARHQPLVIITTSHPHYAIQGFEIEAVDYLLKPVMEDTLARALARLSAREASARREAAVQLDPADVQMFKVADGIHVVPVGQIQAIVGDRIYTRVHVRDGKELLHNRPLREWRKILPGKLFKALDRSTIVNIQEIERAFEDPDSGGHLATFRDSGFQLPLGEVAMKALREFLQG
ncbi:MAG TPA: DNA-binding response regulator [Verrucomicrobia bacterium]|nr:DNA-binding response regulator [Verrucomicrobiota bacterium]